MRALSAGVVLGVVVAAQVGPIWLLCARTAVRHGARPALGVGAGAALIDGLYATLGALGAAPLLAVAPLRIGLGAVGCVVLVVLGARTLWSAVRAREGLEATADVATPGSAFRTSLAATASNPLTIASWAATFAAASTASVVSGPATGGVLILGVVAGSGLWFLGLALGFAAVGRRANLTALRTVDAVAGLGLIGFGGLLGLRAVQGE